MQTANQTKRPLVQRCSVAAVTLVSIMAGIAACQPGEQQPADVAAVDTSAFIATIDSMRALYEQSVAAGDLETMGGMFAEGAVMVGAGGAARAQWDSLHQSIPSGRVTLDMTPIETVFLSEEWAYFFGTSTATYTPEGATQPRTLRNTHLLLFRNTGGGWKIYRLVATSAPPPDALSRQ